jgi:hypothetical protein
LIVVTREDMTPGYQLVQSLHSIVEFIFEHPDVSNQWKVSSNSLVGLSVKNEEQLKLLIEKLIKRNIKYSVFREPDIQDQITAIAIEPTMEARKLCSYIPLALKAYNKENLINKHTQNLSINI